MFPPKILSLDRQRMFSLSEISLLTGHFVQSFQHAFFLQVFIVVVQF